MSAVKKFLASRRAEYVSLEDLIMGITSANDCTVAEATELLATVLSEYPICVHRKKLHSIENTYQFVADALAQAAFFSSFRSGLKLNGEYLDDIPF